MSAASPDKRDAHAGGSACMRMRVREVIRMLHEDGWYLHGQRGSHRQFLHPVKSGKVTLAGAPDLELSHRTVNSILKQSAIKRGPR